MLILNSPQVTQETCLRWKQEHTLALVPTMGCLHEGHLKLVNLAKELASRVVVSIFVNPLQFGPGEDFEKYPRVFDSDVEKLEALGVDLLFYPSVKDLYPDGFATKIHVGEIAERLCGQFRPGHFDGVATVVLKLFEISCCNLAVFGEKDFQQLKVLQQITRDLNLPVGIIPHPIVRDTDGVALSSRNSYLSPDERSWAQTIPKTLNHLRQVAIENPRLTINELKTQGLSLLSQVPLKVQYLEVTHGEQLLPSQSDQSLTELSLPRLLLAVYAGSTRLIDNMAMSENL